nr:L-Ala-D/L-amino acid epimerase [Tanacetum cinerariifolium]
IYDNEVNKVGKISKIYIALASSGITNHDEVHEYCRFSAALAWKSYAQDSHNGSLENQLSYRFNYENYKKYSNATHSKGDSLFYSSGQKRRRFENQTNADTQTLEEVPAFVHCGRKRQARHWMRETRLSNGLPNFLGNRAAWCALMKFIATSRIDKVENVAIRVELSSGCCGWGESPVLPFVTTEDQEMVFVKSG